MPADAPRATADDRPESPGTPRDESAERAPDPAAETPEVGAADAVQIRTEVGDPRLDAPDLGPTPAHLAGETGPTPAGDPGWPQPAHLAGPNGGAFESGLAAGGIEAPAGGRPGPRSDRPGEGTQTTTLPDDPWGPPAGPGTPAPQPLGVPGPDPARGEPPPAPVLAPRPSPLPKALGAVGERLAARRARRQARSRRGLRVRQRLWAIDPWSVFKVSALFYLCMLFVLMTAGTLLWNLGRSSGTIDEVESFVSRLAAYGECTPEADVPSGAEAEPDEDCAEGEVRVGGFQLDDGTIFKATLFGGLVFVVAGSIGNVLMVVLLNLITEVTGGFRYTIIREPEAAGSAGPRGSPGRRFRR